MFSEVTCYIKMADFKQCFIQEKSAFCVPQGSINLIIMESHYIRVYHFSLRQPRAL